MYGGAGARQPDRATGDGNGPADCAGAHRYATTGGGRDCSRAAAEPDASCDLHGCTGDGSRAGRHA